MICIERMTGLEIYIYGFKFLKVKIPEALE